MLVETPYEHVMLSDARIPMISGTNMKVTELALAHIAYGWSPEELHFQFPHLTLGRFILRSLIMVADCATISGITGKNSTKTSNYASKPQRNSAAKWGKRHWWHD